MARFHTTLLIIVALGMSVEACADVTKQSSKSSDCYGALRPMLVAGEFSGELDCKSIRVDLKEVGKIVVSPNSYTIYDMHYHSVPVEGMAMHGGERILIILNDKVYAGQYKLDIPRTISVVGNSVFIDVPKEWGNEIKFDSSGPPQSVYLDQDTIEFFK